MILVILFQFKNIIRWYLDLLTFIILFYSHNEFSNSKFSAKNVFKLLYTLTSLRMVFRRNNCIEMAYQ